MSKFTPRFYRGHNNYDVKEASDQATRELDPISLTVQSMAEDADINVIVKRFGITGKMPDNIRQPTYGDFTQVTDFRSAIEAVRAAETEFMRMPAETRMKFMNDPQQFLEFCENPANQEQLVQLGLATRRTPPVTPTVEKSPPSTLESSNSNVPTTPNPSPGA